MPDRGPEPASDRMLLPVATGRQVASELWRMLKARRLRLGGILLLFLGEAAAALVFPIVIGALVDDVLASVSSAAVPGSFWWQIVLLAAAALAAGALSWAAAIALARLAETVIAELREAYVASALRLPRTTVEVVGTGDIVTRASDDIAQVSGTLPAVLPNVCVSVFTIVLAASGIGVLDPRFLLGFAVLVPFYALTVRWYLRTAPPVYAAERAAQSQRGQHILGTFTHLPTVTAHRLGRRQLDWISQATWQTVRWTMRARIVQNRLFGRLNLAQAPGLAGILGIGTWLALTGQSTAGQVTAATLLFLSTVAPIEALLFVMDDLQSAIAALGRLVGIIHAPGAASAKSPRSARMSGQPAAVLVSLRDVGFTYGDGVPVLTGITLTLEAGRRIGIVGATGSGKSTLAALIAGIHEPATGTIVRTIAQNAIVTVAQEPHVFAGTLAYNLLLSRPGATRTELHDALRRARADQILSTLPHGLDTHVGVGGHPLTARDAQQIALARLILADPVLAILDEATADADSTEADALDRATTAAIEGRAAIVIAHRLSQAAACDHILVLDRGRIVEDGEHASLIAAGGTYARLWNTSNNPSAHREYLRPPQAH